MRVRRGKRMGMMTGRRRGKSRNRRRREYGRQ